MRSDLNFPLSIGPGVLGLLNLGVNDLCVRCTPVVCIGNALEAVDAAPPNNSVNPPNAVKLDKAFSAPGLLNNCANGIALAKGEVVEVELFWEVLLAPVEPGLLPLPGVWVFWASRFAFCNSTLRKKNRHKYFF